MLYMNSGDKPPRPFTALESALYGASFGLVIGFMIGVWAASRLIEGP